MAEISTNICKVAEFEDAVFYDAICSCGSDHHTQTLEIEVDNTLADGKVCHTDLNLRIHSKLTTDGFVDFSARYDFEQAAQSANYWLMCVHRIRIILSKVKAKLKFTKNVWIDGYVQAGSIFSFRNEKALDDYIAALTQAKEKLKEAKNGS